jgi:hypothetical protein
MHAFKHIQKNQKISLNNNVVELFNNNLHFDKVNNLYVDNFRSLNNTNFYGVDRSHLQTSMNSFLPNFFTLIDNASFNKYFTYVLNSRITHNLNSFKLVNEYNFFNENKEFSLFKNNYLKMSLGAFIDKSLLGLKFLSLPLLYDMADNEAQLSTFHNPLLYLLNPMFIKHVRSTPLRINSYQSELEKNNIYSGFS